VAAVIDHIQIEKDIVSGLSTHLAQQVILVEQAENKPKYPFMGYAVTSPFIPESGHEVMVSNTVPSNDPNFDFDIEETNQTQPTMTISFTSYSKRDADPAHLLALNAYKWFSFVGYDYLKSKGIVVAELNPIEPRDVLIEVSYERRRGFDVQLRVVSEVKRTIETIESVELERSE
jgi:hypothetical protein